MPVTTVSPAVAAAAPAETRTTGTGWARLTGTYLRPQLELHFHPKLRHPTIPALTMLEWVKKHTTSWWVPDARMWVSEGLNSSTPTLALAEAGMTLEWDDRPEEFASVASLEELAAPIAKLAANGRTVLVRPRLAGRDRAKEILGFGAVYDTDRGIFRTPVSDVLHTEGDQLVVRPWVHWPEEAITAAHAAHQYVPIDPAVADLARRVSTALSLDALDPDDRAELDRLLGPLPSTGRKPFPYQEAGSYAVAFGRRCLFDEPGVGKTAGSLLAARLLRAKRTIVVVPPLLTTNWKREIVLADLCAEEDIAVFKAQRKEPALPDAGAVVVPDSLLAARPELLDRLIDWAGDVMIVDEAHRMKTFGSSRSDAVLDLGQSIRHAPIAVTGTPILNAPHEIITMLELTRVLAPVFGGRHQFLSDFAIQNRFGSWQARKGGLTRLQHTLRSDVWVRRRKKDVLPQLPPKVRQKIEVELPLATYREAHREVIGKIHGWITLFTEQQKRKPTNVELEEYVANSSFGFVSQLRQAAGLVKIGAAVDIVEQHILDTGWIEPGERYTTPAGAIVDAPHRVFHRPILVWVHHRPVAAAMIEKLTEKLGHLGPIAAIGGTTPDGVRDSNVDLFQAGHIPVMVCSIIKAGVGLTLTRGADALFIEPDWVPANVKQAEDRQHRPGATAESILIRTLIALGTLDEVVQRVLGNKVEILERALGDTDDSVAVMDLDDARGLSEIVGEIVDEAVRTWKPGAKK